MVRRAEFVRTYSAAYYRNFQKQTLEGGAKASGFGKTLY